MAKKTIADINVTGKRVFMRVGLRYFVAAAEEIGQRRNPDFNGRQLEGFGFYQVSQKAGRRWSTAAAYLNSARRRPNLSVRTDVMVTRLLLEAGALLDALDASLENGARHQRDVAGLIERTLS